jgi:sister-chromatid-cohesion protein PDS5
MVGELAQHVIKAHANEHSWPLTSYPGKIKLPADIFRALPNPEAASKVCNLMMTVILNSTADDLALKILKTTYLPIDNLTWLAQTGKQAAVKVSLLQNQSSSFADDLV